MKIEKILNNNAFISIDKSGEEIVVRGGGIACGKKHGNEVELSRGYEIFSNSDKELNKRV